MRAVVTAMLLFASISTLAQQPKGSADRTETKNSNQKDVDAGAERGQFVFDHYCVRCHTPPQGFSPRISRTVAMHMRVRANLSDEDFKALVHFLNP